MNDNRYPYGFVQWEHPDGTVSESALPPGTTITFNLTLDSLPAAGLDLFHSVSGDFYMYRATAVRQLELAQEHYDQQNLRQMGEAIWLSAVSVGYAISCGFDLGLENQSAHRAFKAFVDWLVSDLNISLDDPLFVREDGSDSLTARNFSRIAHQFHDLHYNGHYKGGTLDDDYRIIKAAIRRLIEDGCLYSPAYWQPYMNLECKTCGHELQQRQMLFNVFVQCDLSLSQTLLAAHLISVYGHFATEHDDRASDGDVVEVAVTNLAGFKTFLPADVTGQPTWFDWLGGFQNWATPVVWHYLTFDEIVFTSDYPEPAGLSEVLQKGSTWISIS